MEPQLQEEVDRLKELLDDMKGENANLQADVDLMQAEKADTESQLKSFARVNETMVNMLLEVKQRAGVSEAADPDSIVAIRQRQTLYNQNPHVTADQLRAQMRTLLASKDGYQKNLTKALAEKEQSWQDQVRLLEAEVAELAAYKQGSEDAMAEVYKQVEEAEEAQGMVVDESKAIIEALKLDNRKILEALQAKEELIEELRGELAKKDQVIDQQDTELLQVSQLENQMHVMMVQNELQVKKTQAQANAKLEELNKQNEYLRKDSDKAQLLREEVKAAQSQALAYKNDIRRVKMADADKKVARFERAKNQQEEQLKKSQKQVTQLGLLTEKTTDANLKLEKEYRKMFSAVKQQQKEILEAEQRAAREVDVRKMAEQNPFYIDTYKRKLVQKEQEIEGLKAKLRRMTVSENRGALLRKTMQAERGKYEAEIATLRAKANDRPVRRPGTAMAATRSHGRDSSEHSQLSRMEAENSRLKSRNKELENMQTISETTNQAFQNLLKQHHDLERSVLRNSTTKSPALVPFTEIHRPQS